MPIDSIDGIPVHPLVVHGAVVLVPLAVIAAVGLSWRPSWRDSYGLVIVLVAWAAWVFAYAAVLSGESFEHQVRDLAAQAGDPRPRFGDHPEIGQTAALVSFAFALVYSGLFAVQRWGERFSLPAWSASAAYALVVLTALPTMYMILDAGHRGARLAWGTP